ncbi:DUF4362 domain-containing protein [Bacillus sp. BGMRC 2118]|nr:DUF4362 domain-containing protein [Bacillus sp. BGMRC 2118]
MIYIKYLFIISALLFITSCEKNLGNVKGDILGNVENIDAMEEFVEKVEKNEKANINVLSNGIEGQEIVETLTFNGHGINVNTTVDDKFINEFNCKSIDVVKEVIDDDGNSLEVYKLKECSGKGFGNLEIPILSAKE